MSGSFLWNIFLLTASMLWITGDVSAQPDAPLSSGNQRTAEMKRMIYEFIDQAKQLEKQGDKAGAILLKNKALGLMKSLQAMNPPTTARDNSAASASPQSPPKEPIVTKAEAVVTLNDCITLLNLLGERELGRRVKFAMDRIATPAEINDILEFNRKRETERPNPAQQNKPTEATEQATGIEPPSMEQIQNQLVALATGMNALLDANQAEDAKRLAQSIMLRKSALKADKTDWIYPEDYTAQQEIELLQLSAKRLFESGNLVQSKVLKEFIFELKRNQSRPTKLSEANLTDATDHERQNQLITRLYQKFEDSESQRLKLQNDMRRLQRLNDSLSKQLEQHKNQNKTP